MDGWCSGDGSTAVDGAGSSLPGSAGGPPKSVGRAPGTAWEQCAVGWELSSLLWTAVSTSSGDAVGLTDRVQSELRAAERAAAERAATARTAERGSGSAGAASAGDAGAAHPAHPENAERQAIEAALAKTGGKVAPAAELLGLSRHAVHRRLKRYGLRGAAGEGASTGD